MSGWSADDDDDWSDEEETTDGMGDDEPAVPALAPATIRPRVQSNLTMGMGLNDGKPRQKTEGRRVRVKPMPNGMRTKWPDLVSCLMTMANGKQVLLVK